MGTIKLIESLVHSPEQEIITKAINVLEFINWLYFYHYLHIPLNKKYNSNKIRWEGIIKSEFQISILHNGHVYCFFIQLSKHFLWNSCLQINFGINEPIYNNIFYFFSCSASILNINLLIRSFWSPVSSFLFVLFYEILQILIQLRSEQLWSLFLRKEVN